MLLHLPIKVLKKRKFEDSSQRYISHTVCGETPTVRELLYELMKALPETIEHWVRRKMIASLLLRNEPFNVF